MMAGTDLWYRGGGGVVGGRRRKAGVGEAYETGFPR